MAVGIIMGVVGLASAAIGASSVSDAASAQQQAASNATGEQAREFNFVQNAYAPQRNVGYGALSQLSQLYGISDPMTGYNPNSGIAPGGGGGGFNGSYGRVGPVNGRGSGGAPVGAPGSPSGAAGGPSFANFFNSPGYQFTLNQGENAIERAATATGGAYSTSTINDLTKFAEGTASTKYNDYINQLLQLAGIGNAATSSTTGAALQTGNNISANMLSAGNANASGVLGSGGAWQSAINQFPWGKVFNGGSGGGNAGVPMQSSDNYAIPSAGGP